MRRNLDGKPEQHVGLNWLARNQVLQRHTIQKLHDNERLILLLSDFMNGAG
jgi:hypothetical protein